jgi:ribosome maturation factor RimP
MEKPPSAPEDGIADQVERLLADLACDLGLEIVEVVYHRAARSGLLRVLIEAPGTPGVTLTDCERLSRELGRRLEDGGLIQEGYVLEVSSPGIDRPIRTDGDIRRNTGRRIELETTERIGGMTVFEGILLGADARFLRLRDDGGEEVSIPRSTIAKARQQMDIRPHGKPGKKPRRRGHRGIV